MNQDVSKEQKPADKPEPSDQISRTHHEIALADGPLRYTALAGHLVLRTEEGKARATIGFASYTKDESGDLGRRPITFCFNGGPGSSSVWLHLGTFGPRRVDFPDEAAIPRPPYRLVDNQSTILDLTDLVFIDPVTTGYSRVAPGGEAKQFHGVQEDLESVGEFIRLWLTRNKRWSSPKFLAGESYGTTRAAGLSNYLQDRHGIFFNGLVLVSSVLSFQTLRFDPANDLPYILFLPTYTATAFYHKKLPAALQKNLMRTLDEARAFALEEYSIALMRGSSLPASKKTQMAQRLARYTGLSVKVLEQMNLRPDIGRFVRELLREDHRIAGRLDSRFLGFERDAAGESFDLDPSYSAIQGPFTAMLNHYVRVELGHESDLPYEILSDRVQPWNFGASENQYLDVSERLRRSMSLNPSLQVFVANGYYDLATPFLATEYTFNHLGLESLQDRVTMTYYEAGHMMYIKAACREQLKIDLAAWYAWSLPA